MQLTRRDFLKVSGAGLGTSLASGSLLPAARAEGAGPSPDDLCILYDPSKCIGCRACQMACKRWNDLPREPDDVQGIYETPLGLSATTWTLIKLNKRSEEDWHFFNYQCMHCTDAACVTVCPSSALYKDERGFTAFDRDKCIGCGYCTEFCPYGVPHLKTDNLLTGEAKAAKCTFCQDRIREGIGGPFCAETCPVGALVWGQRGELLDQAKERVATLQQQGLSSARLYGETEAAGLHRLSITFDEPARYGLPADPKSPVTARAWQKIIQPLGEVVFGVTIVAALAAFLLGRRNIHMEGVE
jgi:formate dehydrogenase iron-sulfur subunit